MRLITDYKHGWKYGKPSFVAKVLRGRGAGYIGGWTVFVAFNSGSRRWAETYRGKRYNWFTRLTGIEAGFTHNANIVPYVTR